MKIILSPTKKMQQERDFLPPTALPALLHRTQAILSRLREMELPQLQALWGCNDAIAAQNWQRLQEMDLEKALTSAILSYDGIAFQYMAPAVFEEAMFAYAQTHLRILSGFYGVLKPLDGVRPYRLEMQAKLPVEGCRDLYEFWGRSLYDQIRDEDGVFLNLASREYARCITPYLTEKDRFITCVFAQEVRGKLVQKATLAKMARGEMVRFLAQRQAQSPEQARQFDGLGFSFLEERSSPTEYVFCRSADAQV